MMETDACVHPCPAGNASVRRMALEAGALGLRAIVARDAMPGEYAGVRIIPALIISEPDIRKVSGQIRKRGTVGTLVLVDAGENGFNRSLLAMKGVHVVRNICRTHRNAFDHVAARLAEASGVAVDIDLYPLIHARGAARQRVLHRYIDLIRLRSRYHFPLTLSTNACSVLDMRSPGEMQLLCTLFSLPEEDAALALSTPEALLQPGEPVRVVR